MNTPQLKIETVVVTDKDVFFKWEVKVSMLDAPPGVPDHFSFHGTGKEFVEAVQLAMVSAKNFLTFAFGHPLLAGLPKPPGF